MRLRYLWTFPLSAVVFAHPIASQAGTRSHALTVRKSIAAKDGDSLIVQVGQSVSS